MEDAIAHAGNDGVHHLLEDHLQAVAQLAAQHAGNEGGAAQWAYLAGLWHDLGKYRPGFQTYIRQVSEAHIEGKLPANSDKTHSAAGALHALALLTHRYGPAGEKAARVLMYVIAGHHAGLANWTPGGASAGLQTRLQGESADASQREYQEALAKAQICAPEILTLPKDFDLRSCFAAIPGLQDNLPLAVSTWIRMLFSALVDADFLDTEAFLDQGRNERRRGFAPLQTYLDQLDNHLARLASNVQASGRAQDAVMQARTHVLAQCRTKALLPPGVFSLTVPTGGGKTLSSLAFALKHAVQHGQRRVIYAIPYTSIIEQTADVFAGIFGADAVVEHHSQIEVDESRETPRSRLACENWDAPLIVTTNVQLFESLFAARTSRCRKLHRIAGSVIVLDEAQLLPPEFLQPILDVLHVLVRHYGVTLVLCTATQPVLTNSPRFDPRASLRGLPAPTPIIDNEAALFTALQRVQIEWPQNWQQPLSTPELTEQLAAQDCVLTIVNTRADAAELLASLESACEEPPLHLSAAMCGQHRADVIAEIRARLIARQTGGDQRPLRVISTQLVEAGVDIDFPVVYRALAGLDSIAQAAGRCNREGRLSDGVKGRVVVFVREVPTPLSAVRHGVQATRSTIAAGFDEALQPQAFAHYFPLYYSQFRSRDQHGIVDHLRMNPDLDFDFRSAADKFKLVDDADQATVIVPYRSTQTGVRDVAPLIQRLRQGDTDRWLLRALQRYTVTVRKKPLALWQQRGDVEELVPGLFLLKDELRYDARRGLIPEGQTVDTAALVI